MHVCICIHVHTVRVLVCACVCVCAHACMRALLTGDMAANMEQDARTEQVATAYEECRVLTSEYAKTFFLATLAMEPLQALSLVRLSTASALRAWRTVAGSVRGKQDALHACDQGARMTCAGAGQGDLGHLRLVQTRR